MKTRLAPVLIAGLLFLATDVRAETAPSPADLVPAEAAAVVLVDDAPQLIETWPSTPLARLWDDPQMQRFFAPLREQMKIDRWDEMVTEETGYELEELQGMLTGGVALYVPEIQRQPSVEGEDQASDHDPGFVALLAVGDNGEAVEELLLRKAEQRDEKRVQDSPPSLASVHYRDVELHVWRVLSGDETRELGGWAVTRGFLAAATARPLLEQAVAHVLDGGADNPLASSDSFRAVRARTELGDAFLFVNLGHLLPALSDDIEAGLGASQAGAGMVDTAALLRALRLEALQGLFVAVDLDVDAVRTDLGVSFTSDTGLVSLFAYGPGPAPRPSFIPADAISFGAASFDFQAAWEAVESIVNAANPGLFAMAGAHWARVTQEKGVELDLRRDVLDNLGGEIVAIQTAMPAPAPGEGNTLFDQDQVIALSIDQRQAFELAIETLKGMAAQGSELFETREYLGTTIYSLKIPRPPEAGEEAGGGGFSYALTEDYLLLGIGGTASLESALVAMTRPGKSAWQQPKVRSALSQLSPGAVALQYQDLAALGHGALQALAFISAHGGDTRICDPSALPDDEVIGHHLGAAVSGVYRDGTGIVVRMRILAAGVR